MNDREENNRVYEDTVADGADEAGMQLQYTINHSSAASADIVVISSIDTHVTHQHQLTMA